MDAHMPELLGTGPHAETDPRLLIVTTNGPPPLGHKTTPAASAGLNAYFLRIVRSAHGGIRRLRTCESDATRPHSPDWTRSTPDIG
jgi:hypothetical protein